MTHSRIELGAALLVVPAIAACSSQSTGPDPDPAPVLERDAFSVPNTASATAPTTAEFSTGRIETLGGTRRDPEAVVFEIDGRRFVFDETAGDTVRPTGSGFVTFGDSSAATRTLGTIDTRGEFVTYGRLSQDPTSPGGTDGILAIVADGPQTMDVPTSGGASFSGKAIGYAVVPRRGGDEIRGTNADVEVVVRFDSGQVDFRTSNTIYNAGAGNVIEPDYDVSGTGVLDGAAYRGALDTSRRSSLEGEFRGELFGDDAQETGGVIVFQDTGTTYGAAFGASRTPGRID